MAPDFGYVLRLGLRGEFAHTAPGLLLFCLPAGLAAWGCFEVLVRPALGTLVPPGIAAAVEPRASRGSAAVAVLLGAASHVAWDSFTHPHGWAVERWGGLASEAAYGIPWFQVLQHGSTIVGGALVLLWFGSWARRCGPLSWPEGSLRRGMFVLAASAAGALGNAPRAPGHGVAPALGYAALGAMAAFAGSLLLVAGPSSLRTPRTRPG